MERKKIVGRPIVKFYSVSAVLRLFSLEEKADKN